MIQLQNMTIDKSFDTSNKHSKTFEEKYRGEEYILCLERKSYREGDREKDRQRKPREKKRKKQRGVGVYH